MKLVLSIAALFSLLANSPALALRVGDHLAIGAHSYLLEKALKTTSHSSVFKARRGNREYAIKETDISKGFDPKKEVEYLKLFQGSSRVIQLVESTLIDEMHYTVLELADEDLTHYLRLPGRNVLDIWSQIVLAIRQIHKKHVLHLDLKPNNFVVIGDTIKVVDFDSSERVRAVDPYFYGGTVIQPL
jgi:serine/threonine protein kinase